MKRVLLSTDGLNKPETVAEYLGISKHTVTDLARGSHPIGKTSPCAEVMPEVLRFRGTYIAKWVQANYCASPHGSAAE